MVPGQEDELLLPAAYTLGGSGMVKVLFFDYDDTLGRTEKPAFRACCKLANEVLKSKGVSKVFQPEELMSRFCGRAFRAILKELSLEYGFNLDAAELESLVQEEANRVIAELAAN